MGRYEELYEKQYGKGYKEGDYGYSDKGTPLRPDGSPINFGGDKTAYDRYKETEADRMQYNKDTYDDRYAYQTGSSGYRPPSYNEHTGSGGGGSSSGGGSYSSNPYANYLESQKKQLAGAYTQNKNSLNQYATSARQQAYIDAELARKNMPQQMATTGATGGLSESARLGLETNYQNNLNNIDTETTRELGRLESDYNSGVASTEGNYYQLIAQMQERQRQEQLQQEQWKQELAYRKEQDDRSYQLQASKARSGGNGGAVSYKNNPSFAGDYAKVANGNVTADDVISNSEKLILEYGLDGYNSLFTLAKNTYTKPPEQPPKQMIPKSEFYRQQEHYSK